MTDDRPTTTFIDDIAATVQGLGASMMQTVILEQPPVPEQRPSLPTINTKSPADDASTDRPVVALGEVLGEGGMGVVFRGRQASLQRDVAVKRVRKDAARDDAADHLVREGRVTGMLEHPNIVPIYDLAVAEDHRPLLVMKRIEGQSWQERLGDRPDDRAGLSDWLEPHLRTLHDVCDAVAFAHSRGIVHRDLKPENVMLGEFGEVILVDWGVAVSIRPEHDGQLPLASQTRHIAGTIAYMAPEQVEADGERIGERTDVYLLGAVLHELLTGRAPHDHENPHTSLFSAYTSAPPTFDAPIPEPLAAICTRAMAREPADRFESVVAFRAALDVYLRHRASIEITERALLDAEALRATPPATAEDAADAVDPLGVHKLFSRCRFGFQQALDTWPGNDRARDGLQAVLELMINRSLDAGHLEQAALLFEELPTPDESLSGRIDEARQARRRKDRGLAELGRLGAARDLRIGRTPRFWTTLGLGTVWTALGIWEQVLRDRGELTGSFHAWLGVLGVALAILFGFIRRAPMSRARLNQRMFHVTFITIVAIFAMRLYAAVGGLKPETVQPGELLICFLGMGAIASLSRRRLAFPAAIYAVCSALAAVHPAYAFSITAVAHVVALSMAAVLLSRVEGFGFNNPPPETG